MTNLAERLTRLQFQTCDTVHECSKSRAVTIEARPRHAVVRLAGMRKSYTVSYASIYHLAVRLAVAEAKREKKGKKHVAL